MVNEPAEFREMAREAGRDPASIEITSFALGQDLERGEAPQRNGHRLGSFPFSLVFIPSRARDPPSSSAKFVAAGCKRDVALTLLLPP